MNRLPRFILKIIALTLTGYVLYNSLSAGKEAETEKEQIKRAIKESEASFVQEKAARKKREEEQLKQKNKPAVTFKAREKVTISRHKKTMHGVIVTGEPNDFGLYQVEINKGERVYINPEHISKLPAQAEPKKVKGPEQTRHKVGEAVSPKVYETVIYHPSKYLANNLIFNASPGEIIFEKGEIVIVDAGGKGCFYGKLDTDAPNKKRLYLIDIGGKYGKKNFGDTNFYKIPPEAPVKSKASESKDEER